MTSWKKRVSIFFGSIGICQPIGFIDTLVDDNSRVANPNRKCRASEAPGGESKSGLLTSQKSLKIRWFLIDVSIFDRARWMSSWSPWQKSTDGTSLSVPRAAATRAVDRYWSIARFYLGLALGGENSIESGSFLSHRGTPNSQTIHFYRPFPKQKNQPAIGMPFMETTDLAPPLYAHCNI